MVLYLKRITKALIRLRVCAGWSAPVLFANPRRQVFSRRGPYVNRHHTNVSVQAVVIFLKVVRPLNAVDVHRVPKARVGERMRGGKPSLVRGFGEPPHENFEIKDD